MKTKKNLFYSFKFECLLVGLIAFMLSAQVAAGPGPHPDMYLDQAEIDAKSGGQV